MSCASLDPVESETPEGLYKNARNLMDQDRYEEALANLNELKNKHPYNKLATEAELDIANIHFIREAFIEAESAYKLFKEFHPNHAKIDFVTFRIAMSMYRQLPGSIDRDLNVAEDAQIYFKQVYQTYPKSDYAPSAKEYEKRCRLKLARQTFYIANFYYKREVYDSALGRFEDILRDFPNSGIIPKTLYNASLSAVKAQKLEKAKIYFDQLTTEYPKNQWARRAKREIKW